MLLLKYLQALFVETDCITALIFDRVMVTAVVLSVLTQLIIWARKNQPPSVRSWLWAMCLTALAVPFEKSLVALSGGVSLFTTPLSVTIFFIGRYVWLAGFLFCLIKNGIKYKRTVKMLKNGLVNGCAAYFYRFRSRVYTPPDFLTVYTEDERNLLTRHEAQHVLQHDPLLYRFLQFTECVFWFNPLAFKAAKLIRQDRELLCDERVTQNCSKHDYGLLLLHEAQKGMRNKSVAWIASSSTGVYERVAACVKPFSKNKKPLAATALSAVIIAAGLAGLAKPVTDSVMDVYVYTVSADWDFENAVTVPGAEAFVRFNNGEMIFDEDGLYGFALAAGINPNQQLYINLMEKRRVMLSGECATGIGETFKVSDLKTKDIKIPYASIGIAYKIFMEVI